ncbi:19433_t:CDS:2, partial [Entrophospora sp. SA101]
NSLKQIIDRLEYTNEAYYIAFGSHGPREPFLKAGHGSKVTIGLGIIILISSVSYYLSRVA